MKNLLIFVGWFISSSILIYFTPSDLKPFGIFMSGIFLSLLWVFLKKISKEENSLRRRRICYIKTLYENITHEFLEPEIDYIINTARNYLEDDGWIIKLDPVFYEDQVYWEWQLLVHDSESEDFISNKLSSGIYGGGIDYKNLNREKALLDALAFSLERYYLSCKISNEMFNLFSKANIKFGSLFHLLDYIQNNLTNEAIKVTGFSNLHTMSDTRYGFNNWITELNNNLINISKEKYGK